jgi:hypothetical protein
MRHNFSKIWRCNAEGVGTTVGVAVRVGVGGGSVGVAVWVGRGVEVDEGLGKRWGKVRTERCNSGVVAGKKTPETA